MKDFLQLAGDPFENGKTIGRLAKAVLRARVTATRAVCRKKKISDRTNRARVRDFEKNLKKAGVPWIAEFEGMARGAGLPTDDLLMLNCLPPEFFVDIPCECTSFIRVGRRKNMLFKIRDERNHVQTFLSTFTRTGVHSQIGRDIGNIGAAHILNSHGLGGAGNTGSPTSRVSEAAVLNDCHVLRYLGEGARRVEDVPELFERLLEKKLVGGVRSCRGAIYLFVDSRRGLIMETHSEGYDAKFVDRGLKVVSNHFLSRKARSWASESPNANTLLRKQRMEELLARHNNDPSPREVFALCRDRKNLPHALCNDDSRHPWMTISAQLHVIDRNEMANSVNYMCCGNTRHSVFVPLPLSFSESYAPLVSGEFYRASDSLYWRFGGAKSLGRAQVAFERGCSNADDPRMNLAEAYSLLRRAAGDNIRRQSSGTTGAASDCSSGGLSHRNLPKADLSPEASEELSAFIAAPEKSGRKETSS